MESGTFISIFTISGVIFGIAKIIYELSGGGKTRLRDEYRFAKEFLNDLNATEKPHNFSVERGYYALAGTTSIQISDIEYLTRLKNPSERLRQFVEARNYLEIREATHRIDFKSNYRSRKSRLWRKSIHVIGYIVLSFSAASPILVAGTMNIDPNIKMLAFVTIPCIGYYAIDSLQCFFRILTAELLVSNQEKHTPSILTK